MRFAARVEVGLRPGIADPEGATIERALPALGFHEVREMRAGRSFRFVVEAADEGEARRRAEEL
ncbi:MAG: phosphoribosylformylglycinamidine synthase subunit PurS, partial [Acidimicrobiales bacterium]